LDLDRHELVSWMVAVMTREVCGVLAGFLRRELSLNLKNLWKLSARRDHSR
jgi:hypothetical protein